MTRTKDGHEAMRWCGERVCVSRFVFFTGLKVEAEVPGGMLIIKSPQGGIRLNVGQWLVKDGDNLKVVDHDKIAFPYPVPAKT